MSKKKTKKQNTNKAVNSKKPYKKAEECILFVTKSDTKKTEIMRAFGGLVAAVLLMLFVVVMVDGRGLRTALAEVRFPKITVEDESQTDSEAEYIVTKEQARLAEEYKNNPREQGDTMKSLPQYVVFAFDGSRSLDMWEETRNFAKGMNKSGIRIHFTYFINPIYLLTREQAIARYQPPRRQMGDSAIGYSDSDIDTIKRRTEIRKAQIEGHEIASHAVGHFNGADWTEEEWRSELTQFNNIFNDRHTISRDSITGFRAPSLGQNESLFNVLKELGYEYDTSLVGMAKDIPKHHDGMWEFPVATIIFGRDERPVLSMDYSIYMHQTKAKSIAARGTPLWDKLYDETMYSYQRYFDENYNGNHAPVYIAHHFSKWNDGVYWQVMQDFAKTVCKKENVKCVTYRELQMELEKNLVTKDN